MGFYLNVLSILILIIFLMVGVAFLTLMERKFLGYIQIRKGPNKVSFMGLMQPFLDAIKLFSKEMVFPLHSNYIFYFFSPVIGLFLVLSSWMVMPFYTNLYSFNLSVLFFLSCISMSVYSILIAGWSSNSKYSLLGSLRSVAQTISYEVSLVIVFMSFIFLVEDFCFVEFIFFQKFVWIFFISLPLILVWFVICLAETNRTPFDFAEGESELVSGFNVEYSSGGFALIFLAEYASILLMSMIMCLMFLGGELYSIFFYFNLVYISLLFILIRGTVPRLRYDKLMMMSWKSFLPISLNYLMFYLSLKLMIFIILI
uniref:NADH-ubiquinone oxidoreductase chain 1 n=1 Tax=Metallus mai TaxID=2782261 RepID=A0A7T5Y0T4_9HYME|nr:NADH dehydrogenase subunit 1 [Metallus mai]